MNKETPSKTIVSTFRYVSIAEGLSFLILLFIAMPLKYGFDYPLMVKYVGWAHGALFIAYFAAAFLVSQELKWKFWRMVQAFIAAFLPFGPFVFDRSVKKEFEEKSK